MSFRIQNNMTAMNAHRSLALADASMAKSLERLSSGYRINRAADDAAGLSVASAFRADVAGERVALRNISQGNAMLQVAEGALDPIGNTLTRMKELATQAASANTSSTDKVKINAEYGQLKSEIDRIVNSTKYGATKLLDGTLAARAAVAATPEVPGTPATLPTPPTAEPITSPGGFQGVTGNGKLFWTFGAGSGEESVTVSDPSAVVGTYEAKRNFGDDTLLDLYINPGKMEEQLVDTATVNGTDDIVFANTGITITNPLGLSPLELGTWLYLKKTGFTGLDVSAGAAAGTYTVSYSVVNGMMTISDGGAHSESIASPLAGAQTIAFNEIGISITVDGDYDPWDLLNMQFTVTAGTPGDPGTLGTPGDPATPGARGRSSRWGAETAPTTASPWPSPAPKPPTSERAPGPRP